MHYEFLQLPPQGGKTRYLAERVAELQDEGHDLVVVVTHDHGEAGAWYDLCFSVGIDPSRFMLLTPSTAQTAVRGFALAGIDNADLIDNLAEICYVVIPSMTNENMVVTYTSPQFLRSSLFI